MENMVSIGKILKTHGLKGAVKVFIEPVYMDDLEDTIETVFIEKLPYFILGKDINTDEQAILLLEDITSKEAALKLCGKPLLVPADQLAQVYEAGHYEDWKGFVVNDKRAGLVGNIMGITELPQQVLLQVWHQNHQLLIPVNDAFILKVNKTKKEILTDLPDGFLDVF